MGILQGQFGGFSIHLSRNKGLRQDVILVGVLAQIIGRHAPVERTRHHNRHFAGKRHKAFQHSRSRAQLRQRGGGIIALADHHLPFAVIAETAGFKHRRTARDSQSGLEIGQGIDLPKGGQWQAERGQKLFFRQAVLRNRQSLRIGPHRTARRQKRGSMGRHILEFIGDDIDRFREPCQSGLIRIIGNRMGIGHIESRTVGFRRKDMAAQAERGRGQRQHARQLAAAQNADGLSGLQHQCAPSETGCKAIEAVCAARHACNRALRAGSFRASTATASKAALMAPALPIASVPTGMPAGICTIDNRLSCPDRALDSTGTPNTGRWVIAAAMPGRWAAPPAPAITT